MEFEEICFEAKRPSVTVETVEDESGDRVPCVRPAGPILRDNIITKFFW